MPIEKLTVLAVVAALALLCSYKSATYSMELQNRYNYVYQRFSTECTRGAASKEEWDCLSFPTDEPEPATPPSQTADIPVDMVFVEGGTFQMSCTAEQGICYYDEPAHEVTVSDFYLGKYEVTQELWKRVMGANNNPSYFKSDDLPVEMVSWCDAQSFIRKLNAKTGKEYRLPTEEEWEYAAHGGNKSRGYRYSGSNDADKVAWHYENSGIKTHSAGTKDQNELGIHDMSGNVFELVYPAKHRLSCSLKSVIRGGSSYYVKDFCRVSYREENWGGNDRNIGFRIATTNNPYTHSE